MLSILAPPLSAILRPSGFGWQATPGWEIIMDAAERLDAIEQIKQLKARYFRCMDEKDWPGLQAVFAPDLVADFRDSTGTRDESLLTHGAALYIKNLTPILQNITTTHHGHMPEIDITSPTTATGIWAMED